VTNQVPKGAVEAAHKAWREQAALDGSIFEYNLQAALEAAAPFMRPNFRESNLKAIAEELANPIRSQA